MPEPSKRADGRAFPTPDASFASTLPRREPNDPSRARRILILAPFPPRLDATHGGSRAIARLLVALSSRNRLALAYLRAGDEPALCSDVAQLCETVVEGTRGGSTHSSVWPNTLRGASGVARRLAAGQPLWAAGRWSASFDARVRELIAAWSPDVVQAEFSVMGQYLPDAARRTSRAVVTFHEPAAAAAAERASSGGRFSWLWRLEAQRWRQLESHLLTHIDAAVAFTARDAEALRALQPRGEHPSIQVIPLGVPIPSAPAAPGPGDGPPRIVFVGNFSHAPNGDAARFLVEEIFPPLRQRAADVELHLIGPGAPSWLVSRRADGVVVAGEVPDVGVHLARASVVVAPLRLGGGMRVKVLEAMAAGNAIVATPLAIEGIGVTPGRELLVAHDADAFRQSILELLGSPGRRAALGRAAQDFVRAEHSGRSTALAYEALYDRLASPAHRGATARA